MEELASWKPRCMENAWCQDSHAYIGLSRMKVQQEEMLPEVWV